MNRVFKFNVKLARTSKVIKKKKKINVTICLNLIEELIEPCFKFNARIVHPRL